MRNRKNEQRIDILDSLCRCLTISAALFAIIASVMVAYVEYTAQPYAEQMPVIYMQDTSYLTPDFLEYMKLSKEGKFVDLEARVVEEETIVGEETGTSEETEIAEEVESEDSVKEEFEEKKEVVSKPAEIPKTVGISNEREMLAQLIYAEVGVLLYGNETAERKKLAFQLTGSAILNRAKEGHMGAHNVSQVLHSRGQYDSRTVSLVDAGGQVVPEVVYQWTDELLTNGTVGPKGLIYQSEFPQGVVFTQIGNQYFGVEPNYAN